MKSLQKLLILSALFANVALATTISQAILNPDGTQWNGRIRATLMTPGSSGGYIVSTPVEVAVRNGILSWTLAGGVYAITYTPSRPGLDIWWVVPASGTYPITGASGVEAPAVVCGPGTLSWSNMTNAQWAAMTNSQWSNLTN